MGQAVRLRHVDSEELDFTVHEARDKRYIASESVETGDKEDSAPPPASLQSGEQLGAVILPAALDFDELGKDMSTATDISGDGFALCVHTEPGNALFVRANAKIGNEILHACLAITGI